MRYLKMFGLVILYIITNYLINFLMIFILTIILTIRSIIESSGNFDTEALNGVIDQGITKYSNLIMIISSIIVFAIYYSIYKLKKENIFEICSSSRISRKNLAALVVIGVGISIFLSFALSYMLEFTPLSNKLPEYQQLMDNIMSGNVFITYAAVGIVAPFFEEILFRGLILNEFRRNMPVSIAVILQGIIFGIAHMNVVQGIYASTLGILLGFVYIWTKSIWSTIILHGIFNNFGDIMVNLIGETLLNKYELFFLIGSIILIVVAMYVIWKSSLKETKYSISFLN